VKSLRRLRSRLSASILGRDEDERVREELAGHLAMLTDDFVRSGLPPEEARRRAAHTLGALDDATEAWRDQRRVRVLENIVVDVRSAFRSVRRYPLAAGVAVLSLGAGIGATAITLTARDVIFRKFPPLYREPKQLSRVQVDRPDRPILREGSPVPAGLYNIWAGTPGLEIAALASRGMRDVRIGDTTTVMPIRAVTPNVFDVVGVRPARGRGFTGSGSDSTAILSEAASRELFGTREALGQLLWIDGRSHTVVAMMPGPFWLSDMSPAIWLPMDTRTLAADETLEVVIRRAPRVSAGGLGARLGPGLADYLRRQPGGAPTLATRISGMEGTPTSRQLSIVLPYILAAAVLLTLLVACANVAVLMFAQWTARDREIAIRASIGASRRRIVQLLLAESMLIAVAGAGVGLGAALGLRALILRASDSALFYDLSLDPVIFVKIALVTLAIGIAAGLMPALFETRRLHANPLRALRGADRTRQRMRHGLVIFEIAVTVALFVVTASMIDGYRRARQADVGFDTRPLLTARVENPAGVPADEVLRVVAGLPGVASAGISTAVPFGMAGARTPVSAVSSTTDSVEVEQAVVRGPFFAALGVPIVVGRALQEAETDGSRSVVLNEALARRLFPAGNPLGATLWIASQPHRVVGVAADYASSPLRVGLEELRVYLPLGNQPRERLQLIVRATGDPAPLVLPLRREVNRAVAGTGVTSAVTFPQILRIMGQEMLVATAPLVPLISIGALLSMAGIYGVLSFAVSRRSRELAVRVAVGAGPRHLIWTVARSTLALVAAGAAVGIGATFALSRLVRAGGGAGSIYDPAWQAFVLPLAAIALIGLAVTWLPARRAASIDPLALLRVE
jgi:predicted permease